MEVDIHGNKINYEEDGEHSYLEKGKFVRILVNGKIKSVTFGEPKDTETEAIESLNEILETLATVKRKEDGYSNEQRKQQQEILQQYEKVRIDFETGLYICKNKKTM